MANSNSYAAYKELTPLGDGISQDMKYWNEDGYKRRKEQVDKDALKAKAEEKKKLEQKSLFENIYKDLKASPSGSKSYEEVTGKALLVAQDGYLDIFRVLSDDNRTKEDDFQAKMKLKKLHSSPDKIDQMAQSLKTRNEDYLMRKEKDYIFDEPDFEELFQNGYEGYEVKFDDDYNPIIAYRDVDGDGILDFESFDEITGAKPSKFQFQEKFNLDEMASIATKNLGYDDRTEGSLYETVQTKKIREAAVDNHAQSTMVNEDGTASAVALSELRKRKLDVNKENIEQNIKLIIKDYAQKIKDNSDVLYKENYEAAAKTSRLNSQDKENNKAKVTIGEPVEPSKGNWGESYDKLDKENYNSVPVDGPKIPAFKTDKGEDVTDFVVDNYSYDKDGNLLLDGYTQEAKTMSVEEYEKAKKQAEDNEDHIRSNLLSAGVVQGDKVTLFGTKKKRQLQVNNEDESKFSKALGGETIKATRARAKKDPNAPDPKPTNNKVQLSNKASAL